MDFKGFNDWVEIFRGGRQTDSNGRTHDGNQLIRRAVRSFNTADHEPPLVVGHPKENAPAFGWVEKLKAATNGGTSVLMGKFKQVVPEFAALAKQGLYKKRSASFYPDGRLRHVGFLGAAPPAVKGLADLKFEDSEETIFNFDDPTGEKERTMAGNEIIEFLKFWERWKKDNVEITEPAPATEETPAGFTEADLETAKTKAADEAAKAEREKVEAEFAEKARKSAQDAREGEIKAWYDTNLKAGKVIPAWDKLGLRDFMLSLDAEEEMSFSDDADKVSRLGWFKSFMEGLPKLVEFKEVATRDKDVNASGDPQGKLIRLATAKVEKGMDFQEAMIEAGRENPELATEMMQIEGRA